MRVLLVTSSYLPVLGGMQNIAARLAQGLVQRGHAVQVLTQKYPRSLPPQAQMDGIPVTRFMFLLPRWQHLYARRLDLFFAGLFYAPWTLLKLLLFIARLKPDVVNLHFVGEPAPFVLLAQYMLRFRLVVTLHGDDVAGLARRTRFDRWVFKCVLERASFVVGDSWYLVTQAERYVPDVTRKARAIWGGISLPETSILGVGPDLMSFGRLAPVKGFDVLVRAMAEPALSFFSGNLVLVGDGPERLALESLAHELGLESRVIFKGSIPHAQVVPLMCYGCAIIIPSRQEGLGMVALEAMAAGKPVVASRVGGLVEILSGADAILVEPDNPQALADGIRELLHRLESDADFGKRNYSLAKNYEHQRVAARYEGVYLGRLDVP